MGPSLFMIVTAVIVDRTIRSSGARLPFHSTFPVGHLPRSASFVEPRAAPTKRNADFVNSILSLHRNLVTMAILPVW